jgi:dTDP-4-amino-4,6-dideoxygalactose transaminase
MNREIGSEFDIPIEVLLNASNLISRKVFQEKLFFKNVTDIVYLSTGRAAIKFILSHIIKKVKIKKCWLPSYLDETFIQSFRELNLDYEFYNLKENLQLDTDYLSRRIEKNDVILTVNYFNFLPNNKIVKFLRKLKNNNVIIIEDSTHSFLTNNINLTRIANYSIISLRKWFGIPDGGIAISNNDLFDKKLIVEKLFYDFVYLRLKYAILKNFYLNKVVNKKDSFREIHNKAEELADLTIRLNAMSCISKTILNSIDFNNVIYERRKNFKYLLSSFRNLDNIDILCKNLKEGICPIGFPIIVAGRDVLREYLATNKIYCPIHWLLPEEIPKKFTYSYFLSQNMITIPCDQRYSIEDMEMIAEKVKKFYKKYK